ncbi:MAG: zinc-ribbon domain-containing protein [Bacteroidetes bacterium]|nr:zinc-ribbon domain-containing protein [Bacteroidota bacterium]
MIIYGVKNKVLETETIAEKCSNCQTQNSTSMSIVQKYFHIFWIPFFPLGKTLVTQCSNCKNVLTKKELSASLLETYQTRKSQVKAPVWMFTGLALFIALIGFAMYESGENTAKNARLLASPKTGDIYEIKKDVGQYTLYKVEYVKGDSVYLVSSILEVNKITALSKLKNNAENIFDFTPFARHKTDLKLMLDNHEILGVYRKE